MQSDTIKPQKTMAKTKDYQRWFGMMLGSHVVKDLVLLGQFLFIIVLWNQTPADRFLAVNDQNQIKELIILNEPNVSNAGVKKWLAEAMTESYEFTFKNMKTRMAKNCDKYYTEKGCDDYKAAHDKIGNTKRIIKDKLIVNAVPLAAPIVKTKGVNGDGLYHWIVQIPMIITYTGSKETSVKELFEVDIVRSNVYTHKNGIAIKSHIYKKYAGGVQ